MNSNDSVKNLDTWKRRAFIVWTLIGVCALVYVLGYLSSVFAVPVGILIWTLIIVFCLRPIVNGLERHGVGRGWGAAISFIVMFGALTLLLVLMISPTFGINTQFSSLMEDLPRYYEGFTSWLTQMYADYAHYLQNDTVKGWIDSATSAVSGFLADMSQVTASGLVNFGTALANSMMVLGFSLVISFWILMDLPHMGAEAKRLIPDRLHDDAEMISLTLTKVIGGYIRATLIQCFLIGLASGIFYAIIGLPSAVALGIITGVLNIIPVVGPWLGGAIAAMVGLMTSPFAAFMSLIAAIAVQQVVYTFISPKLMGDSVDIHPALMILAMMCGSAVGGTLGGLGGSVFGMLASVPLVAAAKALFVYYYEKETGRRLVHPDGVFFKGDVDPEAEFHPKADATAARPSINLKHVVTDHHWQADPVKMFPTELIGKVFPLDASKGADADTDGQTKPNSANKMD